MEFERTISALVIYMCVCVHMTFRMHCYRIKMPMRALTRLNYFYYDEFSFRTRSHHRSKWMHLWILLLILLWHEILLQSGVRSGQWAHTSLSLSLSPIIFNRMTPIWPNKVQYDFETEKLYFSYICTVHPKWNSFHSLSMYVHPKKYVQNSRSKEIMPERGRQCVTKWRDMSVCALLFEFVLQRC